MCEQMEQVANNAVLRENFRLVADGDLSVEKAAKKSCLSIDEFLKKKEGSCQLSKPQRKCYDILIFYHLCLRSVIGYGNE